MADHDEVCAFYFRLGLCYSDILLFLAHIHGVIISLRTLKRILSRQQLFRRKFRTDILDVAIFIESQLSGPGYNNGYRWVHQKCIHMGMAVPRSTVEILMRIIDPEGVRLRLKRRLRRRQYFGRGPDFIWHLDSYDKLKPYGLCINGCIDGFSRLIIWLNVYNTSSDPRLIGGYYIEAVEKRVGCPNLVRGDQGTENGHVAQIQEFLSGRTGSFIYGRSTANQRIEMFWNFLRRQCCQFWIETLGILKDNGHFTGDYLDTALIQFCFMKLLQRDLNDMVQVWNTHMIRSSKNQNCPNGRPIVLYSVPALYGTRNYLQQVGGDMVDVSRTECRFRGPYPCDKDVFELCATHMEERGWQPAERVHEGLDLYRNLRGILLQEL